MTLWQLAEGIYSDVELKWGLI